MGGTTWGTMGREGEILEGKRAEEVAIEYMWHEEQKGIYLGGGMEQQESIGRVLDREGIEKGDKLKLTILTYMYETNIMGAWGGGSVSTILTLEAWQSVFDSQNSQ